MNKLTKFAITTGAIVLGMSSMAMAKFDDIGEGNFYLEPITALSEKGVINGYPDNTFKPANKVTRAEFAKMISVAEALSLKEENKIVFDDVNEHWAKEYIELAASNNLLKGYGDNTFKPSKEITYGEVATILLRTLNIYQVANDNTNWPEDCMNYAAEIGLFNGVATNDLIGINPARRDNVALMIRNKIQLEDKFENAFSGDKVEESGDIKDDELNNSGENIKNPNVDNTEEDNNNDSEEETVVVVKNDVYIGKVVEKKEERGINYITIENFDGTKQTIQLSKDTEVPEVHTLMLYKVSSKGSVRVEKLFTIEDAKSDYMLVTEADKELITLKDIEETLDLDKDVFEYADKEIKLYKYDFYFAEIVQNDDDIYTFDDVIAIKKEDLKLDKEDRLVFDHENRIVIIVRGLEEA